MSMPPAGWYPDPEGGAAPRWWDGNAWAPVAVAVPLAVPQSYPPAIVPAPQAYPPVIGAVPPQAGAPVASWPQGTRPTKAPSANHNAFVTFAVVAVYLVLALVVHFAILGFIPVAFALRSRQAREPLAPLALVAAVIGVVVGIAAFVH